MHATHLLATAMGFPVKAAKYPITRSIRMLFSNRVALELEAEKQKYIPKKNTIQKKDGLRDSESRILKLVNKNKEVTGTDIASSTGWTQNHCSMILTSLWKKGLVRRRKEKGNHTRWYVYMAKEKA